jgi:hypothetical protein
MSRPIPFLALLLLAAGCAPTPPPRAAACVPGSAGCSQANAPAAAFDPLDTGAAPASSGMGY